MSISSEITRISNAKTAIAESIANKGVTVPDGTKIDGMATLIDSIPTGGGGGNDDVYEITITEDDIVYETGSTPMGTTIINISDAVYNYIKTNRPYILKIFDGSTTYYFTSNSMDTAGDLIIYWGNTGGENEVSPRYYVLSDSTEVQKTLTSTGDYSPVAYCDAVHNIRYTANYTTVPATNAVYNAIQALFTYDEATKTLNITPIGGGS